MSAPELARALLAELPAGALALDAEMRVLACDPRFRAAQGLPAALCVGGQPLRALLEHQAQGAAYEGETQPVEARLQRLRSGSDGADCGDLFGVAPPAAVRVRPIAGGGWLIVHAAAPCTVGAGAGLWRSEAGLRTIFDALPHMVIVKDREGRFVIANRAWCERYGQDPERVVGLHTLDIATRPAAENADVWESEQQVLSGATDAVEFERRRTSADGAVRYIHAIKRALRDADGRIEGLVGIGVDVTDRHVGEEQLRRSQSLLQTVFDTLPHLVVVKDAEGRYLMVNRTFEPMFGQAPGAVVGLRPSEVPGRPADEVLETEREDRQLLSGAVSVVETTRWRTMAGGGQRLLHTVRRPIRDEAGRATGLVAACVDLTAQHRTEQALRATQRLLRSVFDTVPQWVFVKDAEARYVMVNKALADFDGRPPEALVGQHVSEVAFASAADREAMAKEDAIVLETGQRFDCPERVMHATDGTERIVRAIKLPLRDDQGKVTGLIGIVEDVTDFRCTLRELHSHRQLLQLVIDAIPLWLYVKDRESRFLLVNRTMAHDVGMPAPSFEAMDHEQAPQGTAQERALMREHDRWVIEHGEPLDIEERVTLPNGRTKAHIGRKIPLRDEHGAVIGLVGLSQDVTDRRDIEEQLRQAQKMEAIGQLAGGVAHDFNNLLTVVIGNLELLRRQLAADSLPAELARSALEAASRGSNLTQRLLAFSRKQALKPERLQLNWLISEHLDWWGRTLGETVALDARLAPALWPTRLDRNQMETALLNLLLNARDAVAGSGQVWLQTDNLSLSAPESRAGWTLPAGDYVRVRVSDTGSGMPPGVLEHAFEPFFTTKEVGRGSGLGLSMVYGFVRQSGGYVDIESEESRGTTVTLYLPREMGPDEVSEADATHAAQFTAHGQPVLVVEDDPSVRRLTVSILSALGLRADAAESAEEALRMLDEGDYELLLSDIGLPGGMNGLQLAEQARERRPRLRVLLSSGYAEYAQNEAVRSGHVELIEKPYRPDELAAKLARLLG